MPSSQIVDCLSWRTFSLQPRDPIVQSVSEYPLGYVRTGACMETRCRCRILGFRQTLKVRTLGCTRRLCPLPLRLARIQLPKEQHKRHRVYTGPGHRCGVIPYSSVVGGLPLGLMMMNSTRKNGLVRACSSWDDELLGEFSRPSLSLSHLPFACPDSSYTLLDISS